MSRRAASAALGAALLLAGCGAATPSPWRALPHSPSEAMTTGAATLDGAVYLAYASQTGAVLLQRAGGRTVAVPGSESAIAAPATALTPLAVLGGRLYLATGNGIVTFAPPSHFAAARQIALGTPPLAIAASGGALLFDEIATFDPRSQTELGPAAIVRWQPGHPLRQGRLPDGLRPLPAPLAVAGESLFLLAAPEPETAYYLLAVNPRTLSSRVVATFPIDEKPLTLAAAGKSVQVLLLRRRANRLALWQKGHELLLQLPKAAGAATGAGLVTLAALSGGVVFLGLPALPADQSGILHQASLWRLNPRSGDAQRVPLPPAPRRFTAAPALTTTATGILAAWQGEYAILH